MPKMSILDYDLLFSSLKMFLNNNQTFIYSLEFFENLID